MRFVNFLYLFIFLYTVAALLFWGRSLSEQSGIIFQYEMRELQLRVDSTKDQVLYKKEAEQIQEKLHRRSRQFMSEGIAFLVIIVIGAGVVYTSIRRSQLLSKQQHNFMLSITHELKSPIAAIKLNLETMLRRKLSEEQQATLMQRSVKETNRLNDLCNNLLLASQLESVGFNAANERINLTAIVKEVAEKYIERNTHAFLLNIEQDAFMNGDKVLWKLVVSNLIENACKYSPADSVIVVKLNRVDDNWVMQVIDQGPGIAEEEKQKIFKKFYRVGNEESRKTKGTGLGLYIIAQIVDRHKGAIVVQDNEPQGSKFEISVAAA
jgi:K+-sensing histidine kinase KdpD